MLKTVIYLFCATCDTLIVFLSTHNAACSICMLDRLKMVGACVWIWRDQAPVQSFEIKGPLELRKL